ncbi:hypothetical protein LSTR_LSTR013013 [Laodelphax striatellus]|uniref:Uncharacterized protein n=1 Tax=Laodelphax striatellus TaxID=195883 RepID=A0A482XIC0_LAOST|nr:hypothetical protein LSTR_LSTR013013 [Laodelphax striatellus]
MEICVGRSGDKVVPSAVLRGGGGGGGPGVQSVIQQSNQQSVIQSAGTNVQQVLTKGNVILVKQPNSVIQTAGGNLQTLQVVVEAGMMTVYQTMRHD